MSFSNVGRKINKRYHSRYHSRALSFTWRSRATTTRTERAQSGLWLPIGTYGWWRGGGTHPVSAPDGLTDPSGAAVAQKDGEGWTQARTHPGKGTDFFFKHWTTWFGYKEQTDSAVDQKKVQSSDYNKEREEWRQARKKKKKNAGNNRILQTMSSVKQLSHPSLSPLEVTRLWCVFLVSWAKRRRMHGQQLRVPREETLWTGKMGRMEHLMSCTSDF